jgi:hypothetical protein
MHRSIPFSIYYAQNPKGFGPGVLKLVRSIARNVDRIVRRDRVKLVPQPNLATAGKDHHAMLVLVSFERREAARFDGEAAHFERGLRFGHEVEACHRFPCAREILILLGFDALPTTSLPALNHENITIALRISPFFIA